MSVPAVVCCASLACRDKQYAIAPADTGANAAWLAQLPAGRCNALRFCMRGVVLAASPLYTGGMKGEATQGLCSCMGLMG